MSNSLYVIILILLVMLWSIGYFIFDFGSAIHILLMIALVVFLFRNIREEMI